MVASDRGGFVRQAHFSEEVHLFRKTSTIFTHAKVNPDFDPLGQWQGVVHGFRDKAGDILTR